MKNPSVSVIVAVYNGAKTLERCIDSVLRQSACGVELIVLDGASIDGSVEIIESRSGKISFWESCPDRGIYHAWNKGVKRARGDWLCFLGADDYLVDEFDINRISTHLDSAISKNVLVVYGCVQYVTPQGEKLGIKGGEWDTVKKDFYRMMTIPHPGTFHHRTIFEKYGFFDETFQISGDYDLLLRVLLNGEALFMKGVNTAVVQHGGISNSPSRMRLAISELKRIRTNHGIALSVASKFTPVYRKMLATSLISSLIGGENADRFLKAYRDLKCRVRKITF